VVIVNDKLLNKNAESYFILWGTFCQFLTDFVAVMLVFSSAFAHDSRLRCGMADLYYTLYGRSRPPCIPLPEVCRKISSLLYTVWSLWFCLTVQLFLYNGDCYKISVVICWLDTVKTRFQFTLSIIVYFRAFFGSSVTATVPICGCTSTMVIYNTNLLHLHVCTCCLPVMTLCQFQCGKAEVCALLSAI